MKKIFLILFASHVALLVSSVLAEDKAYDLASTDVMRLLVVDTNGWEDISANSVEWAKENAASEAANAGASVMASDSVSGYRLAFFRAGRGVTRVRADYYLGDKLTQPADLGAIDWAATYRNSAATNAPNTFLFAATGDHSDAVIYFARGADPVIVMWTLKTGEIVMRSYTVKDTSSSRPYRLYRTDAPYNNAPISLQDKFVKVVGADSLFTLEYGTNVTVGADGHTSTNENAVTRGVYMTSENALYCVGEVKGQFLLAYYDSADYTRLLGVQVVEACTPSVKIVSASVGDELKPMADGYDTTGLYPEVVTSSRTTYDGRGDFIYVHSDAASYEPHRNSAFALRPTMDEEDAQDHTWDATINWYAPDDQGTSWPFEQTQYSIRWGETTKLLIADEGESAAQTPIFPDDWEVETCSYQTPDGHVVDGPTWKKPGKALFKVTGENRDGLSDIAFLPVEAVYASTVTPEVGKVAVGTRVVPLSTAAACVTNDAGKTWLGYIHEPKSVLCYDEEDYNAPSADIVAGETTIEAESVTTEEATEATESIRSDIFFVNCPEPDAKIQTLDVWWNVAVKAGSLTGVAYFPSIRENFTPVFPDPDTTEQIVLASQSGSAGTSVLYRVTAAGVREKYYHENEIMMADSLPQVYAGGADAVDGTGRGWNPNVAHALCMAGSGGYVCWAQRTDMTTHSTLEHPLVYVKGEVTDEENGSWQRKVWVYYVLDTSEVYPSFEGDMLVGNQCPGPHPLDLQNDPWLPEIWWETPAERKKIVAYRDRKGVVWARRDGDLAIHMYYANRDEYGFTYKDSNGKPRQWKVTVPTATPLPWNCVLEPNVVTNTVTPGMWTWHADWPSGTPSMQVARTLTKSSDGLDEVWNAASAAVLWPEPDTMASGTANKQNSVIQLVDPTCNQTVSLQGVLDAGTSRENLFEDLGFSSDPGGNMLYRDSLYYFRDLPTSISDRFYYNPNADVSECLVLKGALDETTGGTDILYVNVLNNEERDAIKGLVEDGNAFKSAWDAAIAKLATSAVVPTTHGYRNVTAQNGHTYTEFASVYSPKDHYALTTLGGGGTYGATNWVVWVENDADPDAGLGVKEGDTVSMHVMRIVPELYLGDTVTRTDPYNLLSQLLDVIYTEPLGGKPTEFFFQWQQAEPQANGTKPTEADWRDAGRSGNGLVRFALGSQGTLADLKNCYYRVRYRPLEGTKAAETMGTDWSDWSAPCLAEGWIQRVINSITPFTQRVTDLYDNPPENTVSMIQQIGGPYQGDIALNMDNMTEVGLLETYMTLLNKAESMSISMGDDASIDDTGVNKQLLQLVERMDDFYALLGNEAYSDAANPTIAMGGGDEDYEQTMGGLFAFDNQVPTLLDEELSLLRGRGVIEDETEGDDVTAYQEAPVYNRLLWNYTRGITEGEVAYAMNYNTLADSGEIDIDAETAAAEYPQGHGDAWGHYLSGLKLWYRLLRNPSFSWSVSMGEMNVNDHAINVDYYEEEKMCEAAAALGKTAERIVDLTARKVWRDRAGAPSAADAGYEDAVSSRAFGYGEWGNRGGVATFVNWVVGNSLLPVADTNETDYTDQGLLKINRSTVSELTDLANRYSLIQRRVDTLNANENPLGFAENAVPFGITTSSATGSSTHFEQILANAKTALKNATTLLSRAGEESERLRELACDEQDDADSADEKEAAYNQKLIAYYGYPYAGDIGVGRTYPQDYSGPDLYHWMYLTDDDPSDDDYNETIRTVTVTVGRDAYDWSIGGDSGGTAYTLTYDYSRTGFVLKPDSITGERRAQGKLQDAYADYMAAVKSFNAAWDSYNSTKETTDRFIADMVELIAQYLSNEILSCLTTIATTQSTADNNSLTYLKSDYQSAILDNINYNILWVPNTTSMTTSNGALTGKSAGTLTWMTDIVQAYKAKLTSRMEMIISNQNLQKQLVDEAAAKAKATGKTKKTIANISAVTKLVFSVWDEVLTLTDKVNDYYTKLNDLGNDVITQFNKISPAAEKVLTLKAEAEAILNEREAWREKIARKAARSRYSDMAHRIIRDEVLDTYSDAFDLAQKYTWLAAKAYDYETGGEITAGSSGSSDFLDEIVGARMPGETSGGAPMRWGGSGDAGLSDILARLEENWTVQKPRLGINNPQSELTWFSLRTEAFRILAGDDGLNTWRNKLDTYRVSSLRNVPAYEQFCLKATSDTFDEPAIVIPLGTTVEVGKNFFGLDLAGGDHRFSETYFATKIAEAGVELVGYNVGKDGAKTTTFAEEPYVYLVPAGSDKMRSPATGEVLSFSVADQLIPVPNVIGAQTLAGEWSELMNALSGGTGVTIRQYPAYRANGDMNATTLIGRSVWNTQWVLVIPASSLRSDRAKALEEFVWGNDDTDGVTDIKIGFKTYSHWGK